MSENLSENLKQNPASAASASATSTDPAALPPPPVTETSPTTIKINLENQLSKVEREIGKANQFVAEATLEAERIRGQIAMLLRNFPGQFHNSGQV